MNFKLMGSLIAPVVIIDAIINFAQVIKKYDFNKKYIPIFDIWVGIILGILIDGVLLKQGLLTGFLNGIIYGLSACGLYSGFKNITN